MAYSGQAKKAYQKGYGDGLYNRGNRNPFSKSVVPKDYTAYEEGFELGVSSAQSPRGPKGEKGDKGDPGDQGLRGEAGKDGVTAGFAETIVIHPSASGALALDYPSGNVHVLQLSGNITSMSIDNVPSAGWCRVTVIIEQDSTARTVVWPSGTDWGSKGAPDLTGTSTDYIVALYTRDGGTKWAGLFVFAQGDI